MNEQNYRLVAVKRGWIPEWLYALVVRSFLKSLCSRQPFRWMLHVELAPVDKRTALRHDPDCRRDDPALPPGTACCQTTADRVFATDETYYRGYEGDCDVCGEPANRRWTWSDSYVEDRCSKHWVSEDLPERGEHPGIARIEVIS